MSDNVNAIRKWSNGLPRLPVEGVSMVSRAGVSSRPQTPVLGPIGKMTEAERKYSEYLESCREIGLVVSWFYRPERFYLNGTCYYEPSFRVVRPDGITFEDVKTRFSSGEYARMEMAQRLHPYVFTLIVGSNGLWHENKCAENT